MVRLTALWLLAVGAALAPAADNSCDYTALEVDYPAPVAAKGWSYRLVAGNLTRPRGILFDSDGGLLVVDSGVGLVRLTMQDGGGSCVSVDKKTTLLENEELNHGIALSDDGKTLYASSSDKVHAWSYDARKAQLGAANRTLVANMSNSGHTTRTLLLSRKQPGLLVVSRGSDSNEDAAAADRDSGHAQLRVFNITGLQGAGEAPEPLDFLDGEVLGWGLRNSVGVAEHPGDGGIWSVENSVDDMRRHGRDIHRDNPAEELNYHGALDAAGPGARRGASFGYPRCYAVWATDNFPDIGNLTTGSQFPGAETGSMTDDACNADYLAPVLAFQAHTAPLDIKFTANGSQAFISFHGSWNRQEPVGYHISRVDFRDGQPVAASDSTDAATPILSSPDLDSCPDRCFRPVGLAWDAQDRLWFSSDSTGEIFVLVHDGSEGGEDDGDKGGDQGDDSAAAHVLPSKAGAFLVTLAAMVVGLCLS